jgi:hypothetical protein
MDANLTITHIQEYINLRMETSNMQLHKNEEDSIYRVESRGEQSSNFTLTGMNKAVYKVWAPTKMKFVSGW